MHANVPLTLCVFCEPKCSLAFSLFSCPLSIQVDAEPDYSIITSPAIADILNNQIKIVTLFGADSYGATIEILDADCEESVGSLLTLNTLNQIHFQPGGSKWVTSTIGIHPQFITAPENANVVFASDDDVPINVKGTIKFCLKAHATDMVGENEIPIGVLKKSFEIRFDGENTAFETDNAIQSEGILAADMFEDGELLPDLEIEAVRCSASSTDNTGLATAIEEEEKLYLCLAPKFDESFELDLRDIDLKVEYGPFFDESLELVSEGEPVYIFIDVEPNPYENGWTRITVPILSEFVNSEGPSVRLIGDADVGFTQVRMDGEKAFYIESRFAFTVDIKKQKGCLEDIVARFKRFFY